jgi:hypothetical protein
MAIAPDRYVPRTQAPLDTIGAVASVACALHCLALPVLFLFAPVLAERLHSHAFDLVFVTLALAFGGVVLVRGWLRHRNAVPLRWYGAAAALLVAGISVLHDMAGHTVVLGLGGFALAIAHLRNRRLLCNPVDRDHRH